MDVNKKELPLLKYRNENIALLFVILAFFFLMLYSGFKLNIFLLFDVDFAFREDNFWSYSSSIFRRGMVGEVIYFIDVLTGNGAYIFSCLIWLTFLVFLAKTLSYMKDSLSLIELSIFLISPCFLLYSVDSEIFTLLPFLALMSSNHVVKLWGGLLLIALAISIREISFLFYFPILIYMFIFEKVEIKLVSLLILILSLFLLLYPKPDPTFLLEDTHWSDKGYELKDHHLYQFVTMGIYDVLAYHFGYFRDKLFYIVIPLLSFISLSIIFFYQRTKDSVAALYYLGMVSVCFILTIDYGRYFYLFWMYAILSSHPKVSYLFIKPWSFINFRPDFIDRGLSWLYQFRTLFLVTLVLAPSGYWIGVYQLYPRIMTLVHEGLWFLKSVL